MTDVVRLTLVSHAMTDAMSDGRFPQDESLNSLGQRQCAEQTHRSPTRRDLRDLCVCSPEERTRQTAELLGLDVAIEPRLADLDYGVWRGASLSNVCLDELALFHTDPASAPHGGESVVELIARVGEWMNEISARPQRITAVTHPAVIRAAILVALDATPKSFWRIDIDPASCAVLHFRDHAWTFRPGSGHR